MVDQVDSNTVIPTIAKSVQTTVTNPGLDRETEEQLTTGEILRAFAERRHFIGVLERARILFDPKSLPGVTPAESLDFLIKGLQAEHSEELRQMLGSNKIVAQNIRENFPEFIEYMHQQNNNRAVAGIWRAVDADPFTKMTLQWEIQTPNQLADEYIEEHASSVATDLRKLDTLLKSLNGVEILIEFNAFGKNLYFIGLTIADGKGIDFVQSADPKSPYRDVFLGSLAAYSEEYGSKDIKDSTGLRIPFELREVLRTRDRESWDRYKDDFWRSGRYSIPFDPDNNFPAIIIGEELTRLRGEDYTLNKTYSALKKAIEESAPEKVS